MKAGDKVVCVDDQHWLQPDVGCHTPVKGGIYCIRELDYFGSVAAVSLVGFGADDFFRVCRFRPVAGTLDVETEASITTETQ